MFSFLDNWGRGKADFARITSTGCRVRYKVGLAFLKMRVTMWQSVPCKGEAVKPCNNTPCLTILPDEAFWMVEDLPAIPGARVSDCLCGGPHWPGAQRLGNKQTVASSHWGSDSHLLHWCGVTAGSTRVVFLHEWFCYFLLLLMGWKGHLIQRHLGCHNHKSIFTLKA